MGRIGRKKPPPRPKDGKPEKSPPASPQDDEYDEDGDIATPKLDRHGNDDEPL